MLIRAMNFSELLLHVFSFSVNCLNAFNMSFISQSEFNCLEKSTIVSKSSKVELASAVGDLVLERELVW